MPRVGLALNLTTAESVLFLSDVDGGSDGARLKGIECDVVSGTVMLFIEGMHKPGEFDVLSAANGTVERLATELGGIGAIRRIVAKAQTGTATFNWRVKVS